MKRASPWIDRAFIPNRAGFRLKALLTSGEVRTVTVARDERGRHYLPDTPIVLVHGWRPA